MSVVTRRDFLKAAGVVSLGGLAFGQFNPLFVKQASAETIDFSKLEPHEWDGMAPGLWPGRGRIALEGIDSCANLESGYYTATSSKVLSSYVDHIKEVNKRSTYYMVSEERRKQHRKIKEKLAEIAGCEEDEIAITRNATEALNTVIHGLELKAGDVMLYGDGEYENMRYALKQREARFNIVAQSIDNHFYHHKGDDKDKVYIWDMDDKAIVRMYADALDRFPNVKVLLVSQMSHLNGQILPVRSICDVAHERGVEVIVDGAHSFAHVQGRIDELGCDYYGASLHKWLGAPLGTGFLYIRKDKIRKVWPLLGQDLDPEKQGTMEKFEYVGTRPVATDLAIGDAIDFHTWIGADNKEERLRWLKNYWVDRVENLPRVTINTPLDSDDRDEVRRSCAIACFSIKNKYGGGDISSQTIANKLLLAKHKIFARAQGRFGVRVTPNLWNTTGDMDNLVWEIKSMATS